MGDLRLASAGDEIKVWECGTYSLLNTFNPHNQNVSAVCWNPDGSLLASCSRNDEKIVLSYAKSVATAAGHFEVKGGPLCLDFSSNSSCLLSGASDGTVAVWDVKSLRQRKVFKNHRGPVTCVTFNWNSSHIASGSETGEVILDNVVTGVGNSPMSLPKNQAIKALCYNRFKRSLLAACSADGQVGLWDVNTRRLLHTFSQHTAPATALAFSPINDMLMLSAGLDKRIICYDVQGKKALKTTIAENPLTAIDIFHDGVTVAAGSTRGLIYLYDLRQGAGPVRQFSAHKSSVQCLRFQQLHKKAEEKGGVKAGGAAAVAVSRRQLPHVPGPAPAPASQHELDFSNGDATSHLSLERTREGNPSSSDVDIFSPLRDGELKDVSGGNISGPTHSLLSNHSSRRDDSSYSGVFSPLHSLSGASLTRAVTSQGQESVVSDSLSLSHGSHLGWQLTENNSNLDSYHLPAPETLPSLRSPAANGPQASFDLNFQSEQQLQLSHGMSASPSLTDEQLSGIRVTRGSIADGAMDSLSFHSQYTQPFSVKDSPSASSEPSLPGAALSVGPVARGEESQGGAMPMCGMLPDAAWAPESQPNPHQQSPHQQSPHQQSPHQQSPHQQSPGQTKMDSSDFPASASLGQASRLSPGKQGEQLRHVVTAAMRDWREEMREEVQSVYQTAGSSAVREPRRQWHEEGAAEASAFQTEFVRNLIKEALMEFRDQVHRDMVSLQVEMLRQFHLQQMEITQMLKQNTINEDLLAEVERLKEENKRLRRTY